MQNRLDELDILLEDAATRERWLPRDLKPAPTKNTVETLQEQIASAEAAKRKIDEQRAIEAEAARLFALKRQLEEQQWCRDVAPMADRVEAEARAILNNVRPQMQAWQRDFIATVAKLEQLIAHLPKLQEPIFVAAEKCQRVASTRQKIAQLQGADADEFDELSPAGWETLWAQVGGMDAQLSPLPLDEANAITRSRWHLLIEKLSGKSITIFNPRDLRQFRQHRETVI